MKCTSIVWLLAAVTLSPLASASTTEPARVIGRDGAVLSGEWLMPDGEVKAAAVILQGSGNVGRDGDVSSPLVGSPYHATTAKLSLQLAVALARVGVASLRYDKRGFEDKTQLPNQITSILAKDAGSALETARARFPHAKIAIVGLSEGAILAALVAHAEPVDALFLFSLSTHGADDLFRYQFVAWPTHLLATHLPVDRDGAIALSEFEARGVSRLPLSWLVTAIDKPMGSFDADHDGRLSVDHEIEPAYANEGYAQVLALLQSPGLAGWYRDLRTIPGVREFASELKTPRTFIYQGADDAQTNPDWTSEDLGRFAGRVTLRVFPGLGHCFSPMLGAIGEVKTSGPIAQAVLGALGRDMQNFTRP